MHKQSFYVSFCKLCNKHQIYHTHLIWKLGLLVETVILHANTINSEYVNQETV